ncbi:MAG TPA: tRNA uridine-5-carboxymethylaminomethyl(34) synthesis GTPase MnmE [Pyrinomonadaceae bacterium]|nr:tRNA uridine-5-carboxymethylaminomethyl(34) synthesis GTPase MnmE [Pyrinomonadaceae bacterium]
MSTIVAPATTVGRSAVGIIRLSGPDSLSIARGLIGADFEPQHRSVVFRALRDPKSNELLDRALVTYFRAPNSFTGEDVVEISCHGSPIVIRQIIDFTIYLGADFAEPGEFTLRALANGKMNLSQAEAIRDLVEARSKSAAQQAVRQLSGELSSALAPLKERLLESIVVLESALEFEEDDLPPVQIDDVRARLELVRSGVEKLAATFSAGHLLSSGLKVAIVGRPNVGKSSIFNALVGLDRAIVTELPGTTRDCIAEQISVGEIPISLTDTAGLRAAYDPIETLGIERTRAAMADADIVILVLDGSCELTSEDEETLRSVSNSTRAVVINKADLPSYRNPMVGRAGRIQQGIKVSALTGEGLDEVRTAILAPFEVTTSDGAGLLVTNARHHELLSRATSLVRSSVALLGIESEEIVLVGLHDALRLLGEITGETTAEDILSKIFGTFCIGK